MWNLVKEWFDRRPALGVAFGLVGLLGGIWGAAYMARDYARSLKTPTDVDVVSARPKPEQPDYIRLVGQLELDCTSRTLRQNRRSSALFYGSIDSTHILAIDRGAGRVFDVSFNGDVSCEEARSRPFVGYLILPSYTSVIEADMQDAWRRRGGTLPMYQLCTECARRDVRYAVELLLFASFCLWVGFHYLNRMMNPSPETSEDFELQDVAR